MSYVVVFFFFNDTATTEIYTLSLHDALPISRVRLGGGVPRRDSRRLDQAGRRAGHTLRGAARGPRHARDAGADLGHHRRGRSEEHTSELQSRQYLVCRLLLEKKKKKHYTHHV